MSTEVIVILRVFYKHSIGYFNGLFFVISSQILGYGLVGVMRRFLVWPAAMIWPENLMYCALFRTLHGDDEVNNDDEKLNTSHWKCSRFKFFYLAFFFQFLWYWIPGYICPLLSYFSLFCVIYPKNILVSQITGVRGLGLGSFELNWNSWVAFLGSPIVVPFWYDNYLFVFCKKKILFFDRALLNVFIGFVIIVWILTPIGYYLNWWNAQAFPISSYQIFTKEGYLYNVSNILDSQLHLNETAYNIYGR
jgi:hypothetical protein